MSRVLVCGAGGFIGGHLVKALLEQGHTVRAADKKPLPEWYQRHDIADNLCLDLTVEENCRRACECVQEVYQLACDMGGMGFIERFRIACMRSVTINVNMLKAAYQAGVTSFFYSSSACAYNVNLQSRADVVRLKESDVYPAFSERGYGWEKLYSEMLCREYTVERGMKTHIARFHNVYGPNGTWDGGREKAPAAICRKAIHAKETGDHVIDIWGDGSQMRSYMYINDCIEGIGRIVRCPSLVSTPINLGSEETVSVNQLVDLAEEIVGVKLDRRYQLDAPKGVAGRSSDNTMIRDTLKWEPQTPLKDGLAETAAWIHEQYLARKSGKRVIE